ncbi:MAG: DegT/DnrJ/EryC1/StrS family aminotransferase [Patescibacteria group bacterium]|nr:DegT/DnrJ/EryC1/StrS family aminotransferase [Patescibacteria group bacterium]
MKKSYKHIWPKITKRTIKAVLKELEKGEISIYDRSGIFEKFENKFACYHKSKYALLTSSGTAALHSAMVACGFRKGDEVICPAYTFYATVTPIFQTGAIPILCDSKENGNIDPKKIEPLITPRTKALIVTHMWGIPCDMEEILSICQKHKLMLIEDCSHAHGAKIGNKNVGTFGDIAAFSLQGQKIITGGEGGIIITNNKELYDRAVLFGHYNKRCKQEINQSSPYYAYAVTGFGLKLRAHPLAIAIADEQFDHLDRWLKAKNNNAKYLSSLLKDVPGIKIPVICDGFYPSWYAYTIQFNSGCFDISTDDICKELVKEGLLDADKPSSTCPLNMLKLFQDPSLLYPEYTSLVSYKIGDFPCAEQFFDQTIKLPIDIYENKRYKAVLDEYAAIIEKVVKRHLIAN